MAKPFLYTPLLHRDGSSQAARLQDALEPDHVAIDERSPADLLAFAREYARELTFYDDNDEPSGDWSPFFGAELDLDAVVAFMKDPASPAAGEGHGFDRPHFALFLAFLELLRHAQDHLNTLTRRHLDFHYRTILGATTRPALPDRVNVLLEPSSGTGGVRLPAGTLLDAGKDDDGKPRTYQTDRDLVVNHAQVAELRSLYIERNTIGLKDAREAHDGTADEALVAMLEVALGDPEPGDPLPAYKGTAPVNAALLRSQRDVVEFARTDLFMELFELRALMQLQRRRTTDASATTEWDEIHRLLQDAGRDRDPAFVLTPADPPDFDADLNAAMGGAPSFAGLPEASTIDDLYHERIRHDVQEFIRTQLHFADVDDFVRMMQIKLRIDSEWREINRILERAGRRKHDDPAYLLAPADPTDFASNLDAAVGPVDYTRLAAITTLDEYFAELGHIEDHFHLSAEDLAYLVAIHDDPEAIESDWRVAHDLLARAHAEKVYHDRRQALALAREGESSQERKLRHTFSIALGQEIGPADALQLTVPLERLVASQADRAFLFDVASRAIHTADIVTMDEWDRIDHIVELAQRARESLPTPVPEIVEWLDIHPHDDATSATATLGIEADRGIERWKTFGAPGVQTERDRPPGPVIGWGVRSPLLDLREGQRTVTITLGFTAAGFDTVRVAEVLARDPFAVELTSPDRDDDGWIAAPSATVTQGDYQTLSGVTRTIDPALPALQVTVTLPVEANPIAASADAVSALRLMLRPVWDDDRERYLTHYTPFRDLRLVVAHIAVSVAGLTALSLENDEHDLNPSKPFTPFGHRPAVGSRFLVGHPELVQKRLDSVHFHIDWMRVPADLGAHYANYGFTPDFKARIALHDRRRDVTLMADAPLFFATDNAGAAHRIDIADVPAALQLADPGYPYQRDPDSGRTDARDNLDEVSRWPRYLLWELTPVDFRHDVHQQIAVAKSIELSAALAGGSAGSVVASDYQVNPPYTPTIKRFAVDYTSSAELIIDTAASDTAASNFVSSAVASDPAIAEDCVYHVHPFGSSVVSPAPDGARFLPDYDQYEGELYIAIRDLEPPATLSLLIQVAEGSADPDLERAPVEWSILDGDRWVSLHDGSLRADGTRGLATSGIVELSLPALAPRSGAGLARLPGHHHWLRVAIPRHTASVCDTVAIHTQAVSATFVDRDNAPSHHDAPLPAGTIKKLASPMRGIAGVHQLYTGYGGAPSEKDAAFHARVSERLRHKQRALTLWDYERLVLQHFPAIYKAKCLPARLDDQATQAHDRARTPGEVVVIVIPDIRNQIPFDPFEPKAPASTIGDIAVWLADKVPASATVEVRNPHYIAVKVRVSVRFHPDQDEGYARKTLNDEINRFLSPWAYDDSIDITIGDRIYANSIIDFIDRRPYIDYVYAITLFRSDDGEHFIEVAPSLTEGYFVAAGRPDGVLVAARNHEIEIGAEGELAERAATGVNYMTVGLDFVVSKPGLAGRPTGGIGAAGIEVDFVVSDTAPTPNSGIGRMSVAVGFRVG